MSDVTREEMDELWQRVYALERRAAIAVVTPSVVPEGCCKKGKYAGKKLDDVVQKYSEYVDWLERNNFATGIGFTAQHVEDARAILKDSHESER